MMAGFLDCLRGTGHARKRNGPTGLLSSVTGDATK